jgi:ferredoxin-NADP reductase
MGLSELALTVEAVVRETPDTATLIFAPIEARPYKAGQFISIDPHQFSSIASLTAYLEDQKGKKERPRAYSLASAPEESQLAITIKEERYVAGVSRYPPLLSPLLAYQIAPGTPILATGFTGGFVLPETVAADAHVLHIVAGSGIVPSYSIIKSSLKAQPSVRHTLLYSNKTCADTIFKAALDALAATHPRRFRLIHCLTREAITPSPSLRAGRITEALIAESLADPARDLVFVCGPAVSTHERKEAKARGLAPSPRFLEMMGAHLAAVGVPKENIRREWYG